MAKIAFTRVTRSKKSLPAAPGAGPSPAAAPAAPTGKLGLIVGLLSRPDGARIVDLCTATGWQAHSVRGAIAGSLKKKHGLAIVSAADEQGRIYRIAAAQPA
jgi:hypothetical protein